MLLLFSNGGSNVTPQAVVSPPVVVVAPPTPFGQTDFAQRFLRLIPQSWLSTAAQQNGSLWYSLAQGAGAGLSAAYAQLAYVKNQMRIASATDQNVDNISTDVFGTLLPRRPFELDPDFGTRIRQAIVSPQPTIAGITSVVRSYLGYNPGQLQAAIYQLFGLDTYGGLDTFGGLDGFNVASVIVPSVYVFDQQSDPLLAARLSIAPPQFCILLFYGAGSAPGFFAGRSLAGRNYLINSKLRTGNPLTPALDTIVRAAKAEGTTPIYASNYA